MSDLDELVQRCGYAQELVASLQSKAQDYLNRAVSFTEDRSNLPHVSIYGEITEDVPTAIRVDLGCVVNELRSILDGLATVLAIRHSGKGREADFPIMKDETVFEEKAPKRLKLLAQADQDTIRHLQPWEGGHPVLFKLHEADRYRKHQRLLRALAGASVWPTGPGFVGEFFVNGSTFSEVGVRRHLAGGTHLHMKVQRIAGIHYAEPPSLEGTSAVGLAYQSAQAVAEIVDSFRL